MHNITADGPKYRKPRLPFFSEELKSETSFGIMNFGVKHLLRERLDPDFITIQSMEKLLKCQERNILLTIPETTKPSNYG